MSWWDGRLVGLDLETTGVDPESARIVTAAIVEVGGGEGPVSCTWLADPGVEIPEEAAAVHGVTTERARAEGRPAAEVVEALLIVLRGLAPGEPLVIFNARYDLTVLDREARRHGLEPLAPGGVIDPLVIDKHLDRFRRGSRKLEAICQHRRAGLDSAHEAGADALAACRLAWRLGAQGAVVRRVRNDAEARELAALQAEWERVRGSLVLLHAAQQRWAHEQALGLAEYFREKGDPAADGVRTEWPVVPFDAALVV
jgi:DNA polymerase III epsilon subunit-like protein